MSMPDDPQAAFEDVVAAMVDSSDSKRSRLFGMPCLKARGKAFAGLHHGAMVFKLRGEAHARALGLAGAHLFDPMGGRPMKEWVVVPAEHAEQWEVLAREARAYVAG